MGRLVSVSDSSIFRLAERGLIDSASFKRYVRHVYLAFHIHDIIAILDGPHVDLEKFRAELTSCSLQFVLEVESMSKDSATF